MKPITAEWVGKAEGDWNSAQREIRARKKTNHDAACFHAQQCVEKYLKAWLQERGIAFGKIHDLTKLLSLALPAQPAWVALRADLMMLTDFAVEYRYPGNSATRTEAQDAVKRCRKVRSVIRSAFGLTV
jgi:HEPN domain-containing protein